jgi:glycosyltransferase involved in cell wall biosynthesis
VIQIRILVNATAYFERGGYSVVDCFLNELSKHLYLIENNIQLIVLVSTYDFKKYSSENVSIICTDASMKSIFHKFYFEKITLKKIIETYRPDAYLSLQNLALNNLDIPQYLLIQQSIPLSDLKFSELSLFIFLKYKLLMDQLYKKNLKAVSMIFVQTQWMKTALIEKYKYPGKVTVVTPIQRSFATNTKQLPEAVEFLLEDTGIKLLYVTSSDTYKNVPRLIEAVKRYNHSSPRPVKLYLTINGESNEHIVFLGKIEYNSMYTLYKKVDALIYPSLVETLGLPLIEAHEAGLDILASDLTYAREICGEGALYFNPRDIDSIVGALRTYCSDEFRRKISKVSVCERKSYISYIEEIRDALV